jgi:hypothetical protein
MGEFELAYIDPGSGSFLVQALVAAAAGIAVVGRRYWAEIKAFFSGADRGPNEQTRDDSPDGPSD